MTINLGKVCYGLGFVSSGFLSVLAFGISNMIPSQSFRNESYKVGAISGAVAVFCGYKLIRGLWR